MTKIGKIFGATSIILGVLFTLTLIGAIIGIPMIVVGVILMYD